MKKKADKTQPNWVIDWPIGLVFLEIYLLRARFLATEEHLSEGEDFNEKHMAIEMRKMLKEMESMVPRPKGGRKRKFTTEESLVIGAEIHNLMIEAEMDRPKAVRRLALKKGVSYRTIQRADKIYRAAKRQNQNQP